jgi:pullulanase/glycogen debranching enzyme
MISHFQRQLGAIGERHGRWGDDDWSDDWHDGQRSDQGSKFRFRLWTPTAQSVKLHIFDGPTTSASNVVPMRFNPRTGVWQAAGDDRWVNRKYYLYEVKVWVRSTAKVETNWVTDPYSLGLAATAARVVDLDDRDQPAGPVTHRNRSWRLLGYRPLRIACATSRPATLACRQPGKFRAFTYPPLQRHASSGSIAQAGLTHIHLCRRLTSPRAGNRLPGHRCSGRRRLDRAAGGYDRFATRDSSTGVTPRAPVFRKVVASIKWAGTHVEFRAIDALHRQNLRRDGRGLPTAAADRTTSRCSKIVPDYYPRCSALFTNTCCADTASEHAMMGKLLIDTAINWAREYKIDGFRFDLMGFHPKDQMLQLKAKLKEIDPDFYIYGEGWNFGEVANNARFVQASQLNLAGSGIGTFSDRMRDGVRGGGPFDGGEDLIKNQGFINGLWYDPNALAGPAQDSQRDQLLRDADWVRLGLAGTLKDYSFIDKDGNTKKGSEIDYNGQPAVCVRIHRRGNQLYFRARQSDLVR